MAKTVKPSLPKGFQDFNPTEVLRRQEMLDRIEKVYRSFGSVPLVTSEMHREAVLLGTDETSKLIWMTNVRGTRMSNDPESRTALRFDLTVPLARYVAANIADLVFPFRRHELGRVFRGDKPGPGRFCGFGQFDFDIVGAETGMADAEIIACMVAVMLALGVKKFKVRVNNRKVLTGLADKLLLSRGSMEATQLLRVMDKIDSLGLDGVLQELRMGVPIGDEDDATLLKLRPAQLSNVESFLGVTYGVVSTSEALVALGAFFGGSGLGAEGVDELKLVADLVDAMGVSEDLWQVDPSVARGLDYYTGPVFETFIDDHKEWGSVYSGGRFDDLVARFTGTSLPSVGASVGVDRFWGLTQDLGLFTDTRPKVDVFIVRFNTSLDAHYAKMAAMCRGAGLNVEVYEGYQDQDFRHQLMGVGIRDRSAPIVIICCGYGQVDDPVPVQIPQTRQGKAKPIATTEGTGKAAG